jgi:hypothetical protein
MVSILQIHLHHAFWAFGLLDLGLAAGGAQQYAEVLRFRTPGDVTAYCLSSIHVGLQTQFEGHVQLV